MKENNKELNAGGQAVIEGVMMRVKNRVNMAVLKPDGEVLEEKHDFNSVTKKIKLLELPVLRGIIILFETLYLGVKLLYHSANYSAKTEKDKISKKELVFSFALSMIIAIGLFIVFPFYVAKWIDFDNKILFNAVDGIIKIILFVGYVVIISFFKDVKRIFEFHGAEHKVVNAFENDEHLILENVKKYSTYHPRCGTSFIVFVLTISIVVFSLIPDVSVLEKILLRILLIPLIGGISYEILKLNSRIKTKWLQTIIGFPGYLIQKITTQEPDEEQLNIAITALKGCI
jgi:uncharacterized protein YqhQ